MKYFELPVLLLLSLVSASVYVRADDSKFAAYIPKTVRRGMDFRFTIQMLNVTGPVVVTATFADQDLFLQLSHTQTLQPGENTVMEVGQIPLAYVGSKNFDLTLRGVYESDPNGEVVFESGTTDFEFRDKSMSIYIETDKAIYKPGQTAKFRAVALQGDLRPMATTDNHTMSYKVTNGDGNVVMMKNNRRSDTGVIHDQIYIHPTSEPGDWKITFEDDVTGYTEKVSFEVDLYKLPKFEVTLSPPSYIANDTLGDSFIVKISAKYTYGKPVKGRAVLKIPHRREYSYWWQDDRSRNEVTEHLLDFPEFDGEVDVRVTRAMLAEANHKFNRWSNSISFTAEVHEKHTNIMREASASMDMVSENVRTELIRSGIDIFKPGLSYTAFLKVNEFDGKPLMDNVRLANKVRLSCNYYKKWQRIMQEEQEEERRRYEEEMNKWQAAADIAEAEGEDLPPLPMKTLVAYRWRPDELMFSRTKNFTIPPSGVVEMNLDMEGNDCDYVSFELDLEGTFESGDQHWRADKAQSESESYIQLLRADGSADSQVTVGETTNFVVRTTHPVHSVNIMVMSRGRNVIAETLTAGSDPSATSSTFRYALAVTDQMQPSIAILVSHVLPSSGEFVADYVSLTVRLAFADRVALAASAAQLDAGAHVTINVTSSRPGSFVGVRAVDTSVLLLRAGNDIDENLVREDLAQYSSGRGRDNGAWWCWWPVPSNSATAKEVFDEAELIVLTDSSYFDPSEIDYPYGNYLYGGFGPMPMAMEEVADAMFTPRVLIPGADKLVSAEKTKTRTKFPETWLWLNEHTDEEGLFEYTTVVPDTITSWELSAFTVSQQDGLGIADNTKVTVFRNFFVNLNLPLKVVRGEIIIVQAIVFNYFKHDVTVSLELSLNDGFELIIPGDDAEIAGARRSFTIGGDDSQSVSFPLRMTTIGEVEVRVTATSEIAYDSLARKVDVKPEGIEQCYSNAAFVSRREGESEAEHTNGSQLEIRIPHNVVPGSVVASVHVYGDILGNTIENLGGLLKTPSGCGEQNMVNFAPDVFVTLYLERTGQLSEELRTKAYKHFLAGYQNELNYKREDGSYSAFGSRDDSGSLWLTAFVVKCFKHATKLESGVAQQLEDNINDAVSYIKTLFQPDGSFEERGQVWHRDMQGGVSSKITMTAYVVIALNEVPSPTEEEDEIIETENISFLERSLDEVIDKPYELSIVTYALVLLGSPRANEAYLALMSMKVVEETSAHWSQEVDGPADSEFKDEFKPCYGRPSSKDVETTAYALLSMMRWGDIESIPPVLKWLSSKQSTFGGYDNTQDTVLAIQAMASVGDFFVQDTQDLTMSISQAGGPAREVRLTRDNLQLTTRIDLEALDSMVEVSGTGVGIGVAQLAVCYHIDESPFATAPFDCSVKTHSPQDDIDRPFMELCCSLRELDSVGMLLYKIDLPSGFDIDIENSQAVDRVAKRIEMDRGSANFYYDQLEEAELKCSPVFMRRRAKVAGNKPATLTVMDYYRPKRSVVMKYTLDNLESSEVCRVCRGECAGCPVMCDTMRFPAVEYGQPLEPKVLLEGERLILSCIGGYEPVGEAVCRTPGAILPSPDFGCVPVTCPPPPEIANAIPAPSDRVFVAGDSHELECERGFVQMSGFHSVPRVSCQNDGTFTESDFSCGPGPKFVRGPPTRVCDSLCEAGMISEIPYVCNNPYKNSYFYAYSDERCLSSSNPNGVASKPPPILKLCIHPVFPECPMKNEPLWDCRNDAMYDQSHRRDSECILITNEIEWLELMDTRVPYMELFGKEYLSCDRIAESIDQLDEFTISMIVRKERGFNSSFAQNLVAYGKVNARRALLTFGTKKGNSDFLQLTAFMNGKRYRVNKINLIPDDEFSHVIITLGGDHVKVYVNGESVGRSNIRQRPAAAAKGTSRKKSYFHLGRAGKLNYTPPKERSGEAQKERFGGSFASLLMWGRRFTDDEALQTFRFYESYLIDANRAMHLDSSSVLMTTVMRKLFHPEDSWCSMNAYKELETFKDLVLQSCLSKRN